MSTKRTAKPGKPRVRKNNASEVAPGVFVGGWKDALEFTGTKFCVLDEQPPDMPKATHIAIYDESKDEPIPSNLDLLAKEIRLARSRDETVLVFCGHGIRRAPLGGAWYLHRTQPLTLDEAFDRVKSSRPGIEHVQKWTKGWKVLAEGNRGSTDTRGTA